MTSQQFLVQPGTYVEIINYNGKNITVASLYLITDESSYIEQTIIDGNYNGSVVTFANEENEDARLIGFVITHGYYGYGSGICVEGSHPYISNNIIEDNEIQQYGSGCGIYLQESSAHIFCNIIRNNDGAYTGSGISIVDCNNLIIKGNIINDHITESIYGVAQGGGISISGSIDILLQQNLLFDNNVDCGSGDMIVTLNSDVIIKNCTFYNTSSAGTSLLLSGNTEIINSIIWSDNEYYGESIVNNGSLTARFSDIKNYYEGEENICHDPMFDNLDLFTLSLQSPCINRGDPSSENDPDDTICDMGWKYFDLSEYGTVSGVVTLEEGIGEMDNVWITAGNETCYPINSGSYMLHLFPGSYDITANVGIHSQQTIEGINVIQNEEVSNINFNLTNIENNIIINVAQDGSGHFYSVQDAVNAAIQGDTIIVHNGIYEESLHISEKEITLGSMFLLDNDTSHIDNTIIRGNGFRLLKIENITDTSLTISGLTFEEGNDYNAGGIYIRYSAPRFNNCLIQNNISNNKGGGVWNYYSQTIFTECEIINNYASGGGGISNEYSDVGFYNCIISGNCAFSGGGIHNYYSSPIIKNSIISNNTSTGGNGGGIDNLYDSQAIIINNFIFDNNAIRGGGLYFKGGANAIVINNLINNNCATTYGGGIRCRWASPQIINNTIVNNSADIYGGGIDFYDRSDPNLFNNIIWDNSAPEGDQISISSSAADPNFYHCNIQNGINGFYFTGTATQEDYEGILENNISQNPNFIANDDFHLLHDSPCIDTGTELLQEGIELPDFDLDGNPRIFGNTIDIGAYEWQGTAIYNDEIEVFDINMNISNYPNPFNPETNISYQLPADSKVNLSIYNIKGQLVKTLVNDIKPTGEHSIIWDGRDSNDKRVGSGIYFYKLKVNGKTEVVKKCLLLK
jgi:hypothetical protein